MFTSDGRSVSDPSSGVDGPNRLGPRDGEVALVRSAGIPTFGHNQLDGSKCLQMKVHCQIWYFDLVRLRKSSISKFNKHFWYHIMQIKLTFSEILLLYTTIIQEGF